MTAARDSSDAAFEPTVAKDRPFTFLQYGAAIAECLIIVCSLCEILCGISSPGKMPFRKVNFETVLDTLRYCSSSLCRGRFQIETASGFLSVA